MANTTDRQPRRAALWNGRAVGVINETDGDEVHFHGLMVGPPGMGYAEALYRLDRAFAAGVRTGGGAWTYDDVLGAMTAEGFEEVRAGVWDERHAPPPPEQIPSGTG